MFNILGKMRILKKVMIFKLKKEKKRIKKKKSIRNLYPFLQNNKYRFF